VNAGARRRWKGSVGLKLPLENGTSARMFHRNSKILMP
jgi:hypothetical protein